MLNLIYCLGTNPQHDLSRVNFFLQLNFFLGTLFYYNCSDNNIHKKSFSFRAVIISLKISGYVVYFILFCSLYQHKFVW